MILKHNRVMLLALSMFTLMGCAHDSDSRQAESDRPQVIVDMPAPKVVQTIPHGYVRCDVIRAGYVNNVWIPEHQVCHYHHRLASKAVWVQGYWYCPHYSHQGVCSLWQWRPGHWATMDVEY